MSLRSQYRHLTLRHERHLINNTAPALGPGEAEFKSYYLPALQAGEYSVKINQTVKPPPEDPRHKDSPAQHASSDEQKFEVLAPSWSLGAAADGSVSNDAGDNESAVVLSVFPAPGQTAPSFLTLPHMVLRDPQMPWVRRVSKQDPENGRTIIPWFALLVFTADELELPDQDRKDFFGLVNATLNDALGWDTLAPAVEDIGKGVDRLASFISKADDVVDKNTKASVIAVTTDLFKRIFQKPGNSKFDVAPFRFMSHVRTVATDGTMSALTAEESVESGKAGTSTFSIVVSHRLGPSNIDVPTPVLAHLVSLENIDQKSVTQLDGKQRVLMKSLYSWSYTALPPGTVDPRDELRHLGNAKEGGGLSVLRTFHTQDTPSAPVQNEHPGQRRVDDNIAAIVTQRQKDGFSLVRHRTVTGEQTAAMYRGPLVPTQVNYPLHSNKSFQSNFGTDLQILDPDVGLMDISYASAWQLGKSLAMGDRAFTAALARLRTSNHSQALEAARKNIHKQLRADTLDTASSLTAYVPQEDFKADLVSLVEALNSLNSSVRTSGTAISTNRWRRREPLQGPKSQDAGTSDIFSFQSPHILSQMQQQSLIAACASSEAVGGKPYNYHVVPTNTDYAKVQEWVLDKLHLAGIPAHYLLPDPSYIPPETLRFFHIDLNWLDALVDGALSLANHTASDPAGDFARTSIKESLNRYLYTPIVGSYCQQMPAYGFLLRSQLLVQFPDLAIKAEFEVSTVAEGVQAPILVQRKLASDIMLVLFDRKPPGLVNVKFTLPAHQQTFIAATKFHPPDNDHPYPTAEIFHKRIYATKPDVLNPMPSDAERIEPILVDRYPRDDLFDWDARTLRVQKYADKIFDVLDKKMPQTPVRQYREKNMTSAVLALQLNAPIYTLVVHAKDPNKKASNEALPDWQMLAKQPTTFRFHPPESPMEKKYQHLSTTTPLPKPRPVKLFRPIKLLREEDVHCPNPAKNMSDLSATFINVSDTQADSATYPNAAEPGRKRNEDDTIPVTPAPQPTDQPEFSISVKPINQPPTAFDVPTNRRVPSDLIFSIVVPSILAPWNYRLMSIELRVRIGETRDDKDPNKITTNRALIRRDADAGPPPTMLSNLQFNVLRSWDMEAGELVLKVVPRTLWGVHMKTLREASFLLPMASVVPWTPPKGKKYRSHVVIKSVMRSIESDHPNFDYTHDIDVEMGVE